MRCYFLRHIKIDLNRCVLRKHVIFTWWQPWTSRRNWPFKNVVISILSWMFFITFINSLGEGCGLSKIVVRELELCNKFDVITIYLAYALPSINNYWMSRGCQSWLFFFRLNNIIRVYVLFISPYIFILKNK